MQDKDFLKEFEDCTLPVDMFKPHKSHLRLTWLNLSRYPLEEAITQTMNGILRYATHIGAQSIFHVTLTRIWILLVHHAMQQQNGETFEAFLTMHPELCNKILPQQYYSFPLLENEEARRRWVEPDRKGGLS